MMYSVVSFTARWTSSKVQVPNRYRLTKQTDQKMHIHRTVKRTNQKASLRYKI